MKTEAEIRAFLKYLSNIYTHNFNLDDKPWVYTSIFEGEENGKPDIFRGEEAGSILQSVRMVIETLELILEEPMPHKPIEHATEDEVKRLKGKIMYDGNNREYIPDTTIETFIARMEDRD